MERCANNRAAAVVAQPVGRRRSSPRRPHRRRREAHRGSVRPAVVAPESECVCVCGEGGRGESVCVDVGRHYDAGMPWVLMGPAVSAMQYALLVRRVIQLLALISPDGDGCSMLYHVCACDEVTHTARARIYAVQGPSERVLLGMSAVCASPPSPRMATAICSRMLK